jgi:magnesium chelatase accessory protein
MFGLNRTRPDWEVEGRDWPNRDKSQFIRAGAVKWHVQSAGPETAPAILLVHETGAASHSFRDTLPLLAESYRVILPDLPGHGFTETRSDNTLSLPGMAKALGELCKTLKIAPSYGLGHSAGAAVLLQMALNQHASFTHIFGVNSALKPIAGNAILSPLAKVFFANPLIPKIFSWRAATGDTIKSLLARTGSPLDPAGLKNYETLTRNPAHVAGALGMMASWDLNPLRGRLPSLDLPVSFVIAEDDPMVSPSDSRDAAKQMRAAEVIPIATGGHLLHEVNPAAIAQIVIERSPTAS